MTNVQIQTESALNLLRYAKDHVSTAAKILTMHGETDEASMKTIAVEITMTPEERAAKIAEMLTLVAKCEPENWKRWANYGGHDSSGLDDVWCSIIDRLPWLLDQLAAETQQRIKAEQLCGGAWNAGADSTFVDLEAERDQLAGEVALLLQSRELEPCGHTKNFLIGDEWGHFNCTVCLIEELQRAKVESEILLKQQIGDERAEHAALLGKLREDVCNIKTYRGEEAFREAVLTLLESLPVAPLCPDSPDGNHHVAPIGSDEEWMPSKSPCYYCGDKQASLTPAPKPEAVAEPSDTEMFDWLEALPCAFTLHRDQPKADSMPKLRVRIREAMRIEGEVVAADALISQPPQLHESAPEADRKLSEVEAEKALGEVFGMGHTSGCRTGGDCPACGKGGA